MVGGVHGNSESASITLVVECLYGQLRHPDTTILRITLTYKIDRPTTKITCQKGYK